jgi:hypothetical protein
MNPGSTVDDVEAQLSFNSFRLHLWRNPSLIHITWSIRVSAGWGRVPGIGGSTRTASALLEILQGGVEREVSAARFRDAQGRCSLIANSASLRVVQPVDGLAAFGHGTELRSSPATSAPSIHVDPIHGHPFRAYPFTGLRISMVRSDDS